MTSPLHYLDAFYTCAYSPNLGGANMHVVHGSHSWQLGSIASLARETMGGDILVAVWPKHGLRGDLRVPDFKIFPGEA